MRVLRRSVMSALVSWLSELRDARRHGEYVDVALVILAGALASVLLLLLAGLAVIAVGSLALASLRNPVLGLAVALGSSLAWLAFRAVAWLTDPEEDRLG